MKLFLNVTGFIVFILFCSLAWSGKNSNVAATQNKEVAVTIRIVADSLNTIEASIIVAPGTNARDLMERLFQVDYADHGRKFIKALAGFETRRFKREYWSLEIDGAYSEVGIAEIVLNKETQIVWKMKAY
jgi:hypothetical protein